MAWLHAKLQYINSEWYKTEKHKSAYYHHNIEDLWGWILKILCWRCSFCVSFLHVWDFVKTSGKPKEINSLEERKQHLNAQFLKKKEDMITFQKREERWHEKLDIKKMLMSNYETQQQQQPSCREGLTRLMVYFVKHMKALWYLHQHSSPALDWTCANNVSSLSLI